MSIRRKIPAGWTYFSYRSAFCRNADTSMCSPLIWNPLYLPHVNALSIAYFAADWISRLIESLHVITFLDLHQTKAHFTELQANKTFISCCEHFKNFTCDIGLLWSVRLSPLTKMLTDLSFGFHACLIWSSSSTLLISIKCSTRYGVRSMELRFVLPHFVNLCKKIGFWRK